MLGNAFSIYLLYLVSGTRLQLLTAKLVVHSDNCNGIAKPKKCTKWPSFNRVVGTNRNNFHRLLLFISPKFPSVRCCDEKLRSENNLFIYLSVFVPWLASVTGTGAAAMRCYIGNCSTFEECRRPELVADCPNDQAYDACLSTIVQKGINLYLSFCFYQFSQHLSLWSRYV